ncbi:MAG: CBS domain-containing protein [Bacteroidota bacterium]
MNFTGKREEKSTEVMNYESVAKYMATNLFTFRPEQGIDEAIDIMLEKRISGGPVLDEYGALIGMLSERDCLKIMVDAAYLNYPAGRGTVGDYMSKEVKTIDINKDVLDAANMFLSGSVRRFPVVENGKLKGQISRRDIMKAARELKGTTW